jgi:hypothetical protein
MKWDKHSFADACAISPLDRARWVAEAKQYLEANSGAPFFFTGTGDSMVFGLACESGEVMVYECKVIAEHTAERKPAVEAVTVRGTRKGTK